MRPTRHPGQGELIAIASILMATISLSVDIMLPALGEMARDLAATDRNDRQYVIIALFLGLALGQLIFGPLSDHIGRRPAILLGTALFVCGALVCAMAGSFDSLIAGRVLQGIGAAGPRIVTVALIRDRCAGPAMARIISIIMGIFIMVPVLAPSLGQVLLLAMPWRGLFGLLAVICIIGATWLMLRQPETLTEKRDLRPRRLMAAMAEVIADRHAMAFTLAGGLCYGALMGYINSSQQLFQELYAVGELYALLFGMAAAFISAATLTNARLVRRYRMARICVVAVAVLIAWSMLFTSVLAVTSAVPPLWLFMAFNCPALFLLGLTFGNFNAIALENLGHVAGMAAAVTASIMTLLGAGVAGLIGLSFNMTLYPICLGYALSGAAALVLMTRALAGSSRSPA